MAMAAARGLRECGRIKASQKQRQCGKGEVWLKRLGVSYYNLPNGEAIFFFTANSKMKLMETMK